MCRTMQRASVQMYPAAPSYPLFQGGPVSATPAAPLESRRLRTTRLPEGTQIPTVSSISEYGPLRGLRPKISTGGGSELETPLAEASGLSTTPFEHMLVEC